MLGWSRNYGNYYGMRAWSNAIFEFLVDDRWIQQFLKEDGFGMLTGVLKDVLAIEWRCFLIQRG